MSHCSALARKRPSTRPTNTEARVLQPIQLSVMGALAQALDGTVTNTAGTRMYSPRIEDDF